MRIFVLALVMLLAAAGGAAARPGDLIFTRVVVNGRPGDFLVDTGAPTSVIALAFAEANGLKLGARQVLRGGGGSVVGRIANDLDVRAGVGPMFRLNPPVTDLSAISAVYGAPVDGILGADYFGRLVLVLDYRNGVARFLVPDAAPPQPGGRPLRGITTPYVRAAVEADGRRLEASFQIDSGANTAVALWTPVARRVFPGVRGVAGEGLGMGGQTRIRSAPLTALEIAGLRLTGLIADFTNDTRPDDAEADFAGIIGGPAFAGRVVTIDFTRHLWWLR